MRRRWKFAIRCTLVVFVVPVTSSWAAAPFSFYAPMNYVVHSPVAVAVADFNGDAKADLAAADYHHDRVVILLAGGKKLFVPVGIDPIRIVVADFNSDGHPDFATANRSSSNVSVVLGNGDGTFATAAAIGVGSEPRDIVAGHFNGDVALDLAVVSATAGQVAVLMGSGTGTFAPPVMYAAGPQAFVLASADVNSDGRQDLVAMTKSQVWILLGSSAGTFAPGTNFFAGVNLTTMALGDLNGDDRIDLIVSEALNGGRLYVRLGNGNGTFQATMVRTLARSFAIAVAIADFNGDGHADVAAGCQDPYGLSILLGNGDGTLRAPVDNAVGSVWSIAAYDFNADETLDVAWADAGAGIVTVRVGRGDGTFLTEPRIPLGNFFPSSLVGTDFNNDGHADVAVGFFDTELVTVHLGRGNGSFQQPTFVFSGDPLNELADGDFNNDGKPDIAGVFYSSTSGENLVIMLGNGDGTLQLPVRAFIPGGSDTLTTSDFDLDGNQDVAVAGTNANEVVLLRGNGDGSFQPPAFITSGFVESVASSDVNADGAPDLIVGHQSAAVTILLGNGDGTFSSAGLFSTRTGLGAVSNIDIADVNTDGKLDVAVAAPESLVGVLLGNGDGTLASGRGFPPGGINPLRVAITDVNGDGHTDLIALDLGSNAVSVLGGNSTGAFTAEWGCPATHDCAVVNFSAGVYPWDMVVADFNHDLQPDVATVGQFSNSMSILINTSR